MIPLNYHHLYYFWVTARAGSISAATREILLAQPTLSVQLGQLEKALGRKLLQRGRRGITLTPAGQVAFEHCEQIFRQGEALHRAMKAGGAGHSHPLRLGVARAVSRELVLKVLDAAEAGGTPVQTVISTDSEAAVLDRLSRQSLDLVAAGRDLSAALGPGFRTRHAGAAAIQLAAAPRLLRALGHFPPRDVPVPMLLRMPENPLRAEIERHLRDRAIRYSVVAEVDDPDFIRFLALKGKGVAGVSTLALRDDLAAGRLVPVDRRPPVVAEHLWLAASAHPHPDPALARVVARLMTAFHV